MQTLADIREALRERGLSPRKSLGQNFLIDQNLVRKLADASGVGEGDVVLEVGPGTGVLTDELLARGCEVIACELDDGLASMLRDRLYDHERFTLIEGDCLASKRAMNPELIGALGGRAFTLVANLPYGAATPLMIALMADDLGCRGQFVTIQREVADRLLAPPGDRAFGVISVLRSLVCDSERIATLKPECFWPRPDITSSMIGLRPIDGALAGVDRRALLDATQKLFTTRRKQIGGVLRRRGIEQIPGGIDPETRVCELTPDQFVTLLPVVGTL